MRFSIILENFVKVMFPKYDDSKRIKIFTEISDLTNSNFLKNENVLPKREIEESDESDDSDQEPGLVIDYIL